MSWIESHQSLSRHKKTLRAAGLLKCDRHKLIGHLHELWWWGLDNADADGALDSITAEEIAGAAGWPVKRANEFVEALVLAGFIEDKTGQPMRLHNWYRYAGKLNDRREAERKRSRDRRSSAGQHAVENGATVGTVPNQPTVPTQPTYLTDQEREEPSLPGEADSHLPLPVREMKSQILLWLGRFGYDEAAIEEVELFAADFAGKWSELNAAVAEVRRDGKMPFPGNLRRYMPGPNGADRGATPPEKPAQPTENDRYQAACQALVTAGKAESLYTAKRLMPFDEWRRAEFSAAENGGVA